MPGSVFFYTGMNSDEFANYNTHILFIVIWCDVFSGNITPMVSTEVLV